MNEQYTHSIIIFYHKRALDVSTKKIFRQYFFDNDYLSSVVVFAGDFSHQLVEQLVHDRAVLELASVEGVQLEASGSIGSEFVRVHVETVRVCSV